MGYSIKETRSEVSDIKDRLEDRRRETEQLEENRKALHDAKTDIRASDIDDDAMRRIIDSINDALDDNSSRAHEVSNEIRRDVSTLEDMQQETQESMESNYQERGKVEQKKALLDRLGIGRGLDSALGELDDNMADLEDISRELADASRDADELAHRLNSI